MSWLKAPHMRGCDGQLSREPKTVHTDVVGRLGNGGTVCHEYLCNMRWAGCKARVLVTEREVRAIAVAAEVRVGDSRPCP